MPTRNARYRSKPVASRESEMYACVGRVSFQSEGYLQVSTYKAQEQRHNVVRLDPFGPYDPIGNDTTWDAGRCEEQQNADNRGDLQSQMYSPNGPSRLARCLARRTESTGEGSRYRDRNR